MANDAGSESSESVVEPSPWLRPWVSEFRLIRSSPGEFGTLIRLPTASTCLMFRIRGDGAGDLNAIGPLRRARYKQVDSALFYLRATLRTGAARQILGVPLHEIADRIVPLDMLWSRTARTLCDQLLNGAHGSSISSFEHVLRQFVAPSSRGSVFPVGRIVRAMDEEPGKPIDEYARLTGLSARQIRHLFRTELGLSPKRYSRIARVKQILSGAYGDRGLAELAIDGGYYDQAHMIAEFRNLLDSTPRAFLAEWRANGPTYSASREWAVKRKPRAT